MSDDQDPTKVLIRSKNPLAFLLGRHRRGLTFHEIGEELREVAESVASIGKGGKLVVTIDIKPASKGATGQVVTAIQSKATVPQQSREDVLFVGNDGGLTDRDPAQPELPMADRSEK